MVYPKVKDEVIVPRGTPDRTLFVSVDGTWQKKGNAATLEDCARGYWTVANLSAAHADECDWLMARKRGKIVGVWKISRQKGWMAPSESPKKSWKADKPTDHPRLACELISVGEQMEKRYVGKAVHLGRCPNSLRGYFSK